ncbi:hypothetical protein KEM52_000072, partial [Ascosphaera acerosa]
YSGRERGESSPARPARRVARAGLADRRVHLQALRPAVHHLPPAEVLPHPREPQLLHRPQHREQDRQLQHHRGADHGRHGGIAGVCRQVLLPGCEEGICM